MPSAAELKSHGTQLIGKFISELNAVAGKGEVVLGLEGAQDYIMHLAKARSAKSIVQGSVGLAKNLNLKERLASVGTSLYSAATEDYASFKSILESADMGITGVDLAVAETGSLIMITENDVERLISCLPRVHVALLRPSDLVKSLWDVASFLRRVHSSGSSNVVSFVTGPSRTGDIELKLVLGVHGPHEVHALIVNGE